jgi:uncharacterized membrane protein
MDDMLILLWTFVGSSLLLIALSIPMILKRVKPNGWYGFRTPKTFSDPDIWYKANTYAGWRLLWAGVIGTIGGVVLFYLPGIDVARYGFGFLAVIGIPLTVGIIQSLIYLNRL